VTRLAENPAVSEQTITALGGHLSKRMLEHYSHIRVAAKRAAIEALKSPTGISPHKIPHSQPAVETRGPKATAKSF
jgi:hypothetical protein